MKTKKVLYEFLLYSVFAFYLVILFGLLFMKARSFSSINIVPFYSISSFISGETGILRAFAFSNIVGNIVLFIPLGVYLPLFFQGKSILKNVLWITLISMSIEILQFAFKVGVSDIDDVILNSLGGFIGVLAFRGLLLIVKDYKKVK